MLREKLGKRKGFTLIEIIVVIVILAVLMAVAVPSVMSYMNEGNNAKYEAVARSVLVRAQTDVAKSVSIGNITSTNSDGADVKDFRYIDGSETTIAKDLDGSHYGSNVKVTTSKVELSKSDSGDLDVKSVICTISLDGGSNSKTATITANKQVKLS